MTAVTRPGENELKFSLLAPGAPYDIVYRMVFEMIAFEAGFTFAARFNPTTFSKSNRAMGSRTTRYNLRDFPTAIRNTLHPRTGPLRNGINCF